MVRVTGLLLAGVLLLPGAALAQSQIQSQTQTLARATVDAAEPSAIAVTVYRDPNRGEGGAMNRDWPQGFAMISETRQVTLPPGESTIRFEGVAEGMVAVSAIVTGLPGGTIEKNRNADLLSPASLVDGTLGNRVRVTRTNPATGQEVAESAVIRTRADGGLVLQTAQGYEAVRCSGLMAFKTVCFAPLVVVVSTSYSCVQVTSDTKRCICVAVILVRMCALASGAMVVSSVYSSCEVSVSARVMI